MAVRCARALSISALLLIGCSGAGNTDLFEGSSEQNDTAATVPTPSEASPSKTDTPKPSTPTTPTYPTPKDDPNAPPTTPACTSAAEPNNDIDHATLFTTSLCGKIDSATDVDFGRFVLPPGAKGVVVDHSEVGGKLSYRYFINGQSVPLQGDELPALPGATYSVQIRLATGATAGDRPTYTLDVSFD